MSQFINCTNRTFGMCMICRRPVYGFPTTYSDITYLEDFGAVRITDRVTTECGHNGFVVTGSDIVTFDDLGAATSESLIEGDYIAYFIESLPNIVGD